MLRLNQLKAYKRHLENRYFQLLEKSNDYRFVDETKSDTAAYKAMKIKEKLNRVNYLNQELINPVV